jgi:LMBR1 domain-containing protein 1
MLDSFFPLFGTLTIGTMAIYLLLCASVGAAKFGTRFFLIEVHPLEPGKTLLNSFMFNVQLVLLCVLPTVQFSTNAFSQYARATEADNLFGTQMNYIQGFRFFWQYNVFLFVLLSFVLLSLIYFSCFPSDRDALAKAFKAVQEQKKKERQEFGRRLDQQGGALSLVV